MAMAVETESCSYPLLWPITSRLRVFSCANDPWVNPSSRTTSTDGLLQSHGNLPAEFTAPPAGTSSDAIRSRMNSAASRAFWWA